MNRQKAEVDEKIILSSQDQTGPHAIFVRPLAEASGL